MSAVYPCTINFRNAVNSPGAQQKKISLMFPAGPINVALDGTYLIHLTADFPAIAIQIGPFDTGYPNATPPAAPAFQLDPAYPSQAWHGVWSDAPSTRVPIGAVGITFLEFANADDVRTLTIQPGRF